MAVIKEGFSGQPLDIRVSGQDGRGEIWTEMVIDTERVRVALEIQEKGTKVRQEVLHYATIEELIILRNELNEAIKKIAGV